MSCLQIILGIVFLLAAAGEIYGMEFKKKKIRFFTTPIIMPLLAVFYISTVSEFSLIILIAAWIRACRGRGSNGLTR